MDFIRFIRVINWWDIGFYLFSAIIVIQLFYYLWFFRRLAFHNPLHKIQSQQHPVSVVICSRDEADNLALNLPGVLVQSYPSSFEVIVVNDNSVDESKYVLVELKKTFKFLHNVELTQEAKHIIGKKYPLSIGIKEAKHEIVLLTDSDCVPASENWIQKMQDAYSNGIEIVLGYGAYYKKPGLLNKLIRFETFHSALHYLSFSLAGVPYMGVGRNLSYKKDLFFKSKGFSFMNHLPGGDDDLFINRVANSRNTAIVIDEEAFTLSNPKKTWGAWVRQKQRHYSTSKYYKPVHKFLLGLFSFSQFFLYPVFVLSLFSVYWQIALGILGFRILVQGIIYFKAMKKLNEFDLWPLFLFFDIWMFFYYIIFAPSIWKKSRSTWN